MYANSQAGGLDVCPLDICKIPPVGIPIPYTNIASGAQAIPNVTTILYGGGFVHNIDTVIPISSGNEAGILGGVVSGVIKGRSKHVIGSKTVIIQGGGVTRLTTPNMANGNNGVGSRLTPSQTKILIQAS